MKATLDHEGLILREGAVVLRTEAPAIWRRAARKPGTLTLLRNPDQLTRLAAVLEKAVTLAPADRGSFLRTKLPATVLPQLTLIAEGFLDGLAVVDEPERRTRQRLGTIMGDLHLLVTRYRIPDEPEPPDV